MNPLPQPLDGDAPRGAGVKVGRVDARRNREAVLNAADRLFTRGGWAVGMADVAATADVGIGTVYRHFGSKQVLLGALVARRFDVAISRVDSLSGSDDPPFGLLERALRLGATMVVTDPLTRLATRGAGSGGWEYAEDARRRLDEAFTPLVAAAHRDRSLRPDVRVEDVSMLMAAVCATVDDARPERWQHFLDIAVDGLRARRGAAGPVPRDGTTTAGSSNGLDE